jgi:hypothetical protein
MSLLLNNKRRRSTGGGGSDPYANNVVLFLKGDGTNGSTNIVDSSPNPKTISVFGNTQISTVQSKYGGSSIFFDGNGDYLTISDDPIWDFGTSNFTIEFWGYFTGAYQNYRRILSFGVGGNESIILEQDGTGKIVPSLSGTSAKFTSSSAFPLNTWNHLAYVRDGTNFQLYFNGTPVGSTTSSDSSPASSGVIIGAWLYLSSPSRFIQAYLDSFRITFNVARYTSAFNPETDTYLNV